MESLIAVWREAFGLPPFGTENPELSWKLVQEEYKELSQALESEPDNVDKELADLTWVAIMMMYDRGLDPYTLMSKLSASNMSKICKTEQEAKDYIAKQDFECYIQQSSHGYIVKRASDNKIMKANYVQFSDL